MSWRKDFALTGYTSSAPSVDIYPVFVTRGFGLIEDMELQRSGDWPVAKCPCRLGRFGRWKLRSLPKPSQHAMWQFYAVMKRLCVFKGLFQDRPVTNSQKFWLQKTQTSRKFGGSNSLQVGDMKSLVAQVGLANDDFLVFWFAWLDGMTFFPILQSHCSRMVHVNHVQLHNLCKRESR